METVLRPLEPSSRSARRKANLRRPEAYGADRENTPPLHPNVQIQTLPSIASPKKKLPPAPSSTAIDDLKKESDTDSSQVTYRDVSSPSSSTDLSDPSVKVVVRVRPSSGQQQGNDVAVMKLSSDSVSIGDRTFNFDSVLGPNSTQEDLFRSVGIPLVRNCLSGFNTSVISYGQTGSGKTYTMWGPPSAMIDNSINQGIVPRVFHMLFSEIHTMQDGFEEKHINYQCRCSFLEVYNERVNDLLDPTQKNLLIRDDGRDGFHVENLTDEYVSTAEDVIQLLVKGLANRKVGSTSLNSRSSRSHIIFTFIVESWCKGSESKCFSSSKSSRINFIDFAGAERGILDGVGKQHAEEARQIKQSLSKLGRLVNVLGEASNYGGDRKSPYMDCCLTQLLQDILGGNAKLTVICTISPDSSQASTLSTLRFGERARQMQNKAVINEITEDDVNGLSDQIRQLKEEIIKAKLEEGNPVATIGGLFGGPNARESLNFLRVSLNRSLILPNIDLESEEMDVDEEDVRDLCVQIGNLNASLEDKPNDTLNTSLSGESTDIRETSALSCTVDSCYYGDSVSSISDQILEENCPELSGTRMIGDNSVTSTKSLVYEDYDARISQPKDSIRKSGLSINPCQQSPVLQDPTLCSSPKLYDNLKKRVVSFNSVASQNGVDVSLKSNSHLATSRKTSELSSSLICSKVNPTESLAASLHRGLQIIDYHERNTAARRSFFGLSFEHLASLSSHSAEKVDTAMQTLLGDGYSASFLCSSGRPVKDVSRCDVTTDSMSMQIVPVDSTGPSEITGREIYKQNDVLLTNSSKREMELEALCRKQACTIKHLTVLIDQHEEEKSQSSNEEQISGHSCMINYSQNSGIPMEKSSDKSSFDMTEKEALVLEIQQLKDELKFFKDAGDTGSLLEEVRNGKSRSCNGEDEFEKEKERWLESESRWICLTEELRLDLDCNRRLAEKKDIELDQEKKCREELDDALQRSILGHAKFIEHYADLQEKYNDLLGRHRKLMEGIAEVKKAVAKAGGKGCGTAFATALAAELSTLRIDREKERAYLKEQNRRLKIQLRDTAEAVHAAGELLVRLREAEEAAFVAKENCKKAQQERDEKMKAMDKLKKKHVMELATLKHLLAESKLPESALDLLFRQEFESAGENRAQTSNDDQSWRAAFQPSYE